MALVSDHESVARDSRIWIPNHAETKLANLAGRDARDAKPFTPTQASVYPADTFGGDDHRHVELVEVPAGRPLATWCLIIVCHLVGGDPAPELRVVRYPLVI
jgi:hypothetical protein